MTEKRFQWVFIKDNELEFQDNGIVKRFNNYRLEEFLNELQMRYEAQRELYCQLDCVKNRLYVENEELKQRNDRQAKQLDRLYHLIEEKDWRALSDILDDFKRCEEQLQRESGTYGDFE